MPVSNVFATSVSGLQSFNQQLSNIAENVANSSTIGYKEVSTAFQSFVASASSSANQGGGTLAKPIYNNDLQGGLTSVASQTSIAVNGQGFLAVQQPFFQASGPSFNNVPTSYTRAGDFAFNAQGFLVNSSGQFLLGVPNQGGSFNISANQLTQIQKTAANVTAAGTQSANVTYNINFPANAVTSTNATGLQTTQVQIFDSLGTAHSIPLNFIPLNTTTTTPLATAPNQWYLQMSTVTLPAGIASFTVTGGLTGTNNGIFQFNTDGTLTPSNASAAAMNLNLAITYSPTVAGLPPVNSVQTVKINLGTTANNTNTGAAGYIAGTGSTQFAGTSLTTNSVTVDGQSAGVFQSATVTNQGFVVFNYSNGTQVNQYQVPVFTFANPDGLTRLSGALFAQNTSTSGVATPNISGQGGAGGVLGGTIENSNVDISQQFTDMITAQRSYEANAKVVTTGDTVTQDTINLIR